MKYTLKAFEGSGGMPIAGPVIWSCMMRDWSAAEIYINNKIINISYTLKIGEWHTGIVTHKNKASANTVQSTSY